MVGFRGGMGETGVGGVCVGGEGDTTLTMFFDNSVLSNLID